ncbi:MAG: hypothetical protein P8127_03150 [Acidobacteriota bacterium]
MSSGSASTTDTPFTAASTGGAPACMRSTATRTASTPFFEATATGSIPDSLARAGNAVAAEIAAVAAAPTAIASRRVRSFIAGSELLGPLSFLMMDMVAAAWLHVKEVRTDARATLR